MGALQLESPDFNLGRCSVSNGQPVGGSSPSLTSKENVLGILKAVSAQLDSMECALFDRVNGLLQHDLALIHASESAFYRDGEQPFGELSNIGFSYQTLSALLLKGEATPQLLEAMGEEAFGDPLAFILPPDSLEFGVPSSIIRTIQLMFFEDRSIMLGLELARYAHLTKTKSDVANWIPQVESCPILSDLKLQQLVLNLIEVERYLYQEQSTPMPEDVSRGRRSAHASVWNFLRDEYSARKRNAEIARGQI